MLVFLAVVMLIGSYLAGSVPLMVTLSEVVAHKQILTYLVLYIKNVFMSLQTLQNFFYH